MGDGVAAEPWGQGQAPPARSQSGRKLRMGFVLDVAGYGVRSAPLQNEVQRRLPPLVVNTLAKCGMDLDDVGHEWTGDGINTVMPGRHGPGGRAARADPLARRESRDGQCPQRRPDPAADGRRRRTGRAQQGRLRRAHDRRYQPAGEQRAAARRIVRLSRRRSRGGDIGSGARHRNPARLSGNSRRPVHPGGRLGEGIRRTRLDMGIRTSGGARRPICHSNRTTRAR